MLTESIRCATKADLNELAIIGPAACADGHSHYWPDPAASARHLVSSGREAFAAQLESELAWVEGQDARFLGFITMALGFADPIVRTPNGAELRRFYLVGIERVGDSDLSETVQQRPRRLL